MEVEDFPPFRVPSGVDSAFVWLPRLLELSDPSAVKLNIDAELLGADCDLRVANHVLGSQMNI